VVGRCSSVSKPVLTLESAFGFSACSFNMMIRFQTLLSNSTCAATLWWAAQAACWGLPGAAELATLLIATVGRCRLTVSKSVLKARRDTVSALTLNFDKLISSFAFKLTLRHYMTGADVAVTGTDAGGNASSPLWWAARGASRGEAGALAMATLLVERGAAVDAIGVAGDESARGRNSDDMDDDDDVQYDDSEDDDDDDDDDDEDDGEKDDRGFQCTPLWWLAGAACAREDAGGLAALELVKLLLARGADVNAAASCGGKSRTPLSWAAGAVRGSIQCVARAAAAGGRKREDQYTFGPDGRLVIVPVRPIGDIVGRSSELVLLLLSAGARLADANDEKEQFQPIIDGVQKKSEEKEPTKNE